MIGDSTVTVIALHGTAIAMNGRAALLTGASGSGKSDLALRCLAMPALPGVPDRFELVADDQVLVTRDGGDLVLSAPGAIAGKLEVRGVGILDLPVSHTSRLCLVAALIGADAPIERLPERFETRNILGVWVPVVPVKPFEASTPAKLAMALRI